MTARWFSGALAVASASAVVFGGGAAAASPTIRMAIVHVVHGCHTWGMGAKLFGPSRTMTFEHGTKLVVRVNCPMDFQLVQAAGPHLRLGGNRFYAGTTRTIVFAKSGVYKLRAKNVQTSEERGLDTLGPDNVLKLTVRVK